MRKIDLTWRADENKNKWERKKKLAIRDDREAGCGE